MTVFTAFDLRSPRRLSSPASVGPKVGCGVALLRGAKLLLIRRGRPPVAGCWSLPGGKVERWERTDDAARREVAEELGVKVGELALLCVVDLLLPHEDAHWVSPTYLALDFEGEPMRLEPEKHTDLDWFALDALPTPLAQSVPAAAAALRLRVKRE
jgi:ADP-ribose pyrophosphatase YjhB (NUDIX family)